MFSAFGDVVLVLSEEREVLDMLLLSGARECAESFETVKRTEMFWMERLLFILKNKCNFCLARSHLLQLMKQVVCVCVSLLFLCVLNERLLSLSPS